MIKHSENTGTVQYVEWLKTVPACLTADALWKLQAYRLSLFAADLAWRDVTNLVRDRRCWGLSHQLLEAVGSIGANLSEGYSRGSAKDRVRFYEYSLGSAREARTWYFEARHAIREPVAKHRLEFLTQVVKLLLTIIPSERGEHLREDTVAYNCAMRSEEPGIAPALLNDVPLT